MLSRNIVVLLVFCLTFGFTLTGCVQKAASSSEAIETAKAMETPEAKTNYLMQQARAFYNSKDFQEAINIAQHVLNYLDKDSQEAKDLIEKAKQKLSELAQQKTNELKSKISNIGK